MKEGIIILGMENFLFLSSHLWYRFLKNEVHPLGTYTGFSLLGFVSIFTVPIVNVWFRRLFCFFLLLGVCLILFIFLIGELGEVIWSLTLSLTWLTQGKKLLSVGHGCFQFLTWLFLFARLGINVFAPVPILNPSRVGCVINLKCITVFL